MRMETRVLVIFTLFLFTNVVSLKRRIKTKRCRYVFVVNELDTSTCPSAVPQLQADREQKHNRKTSSLHHSRPLNYAAPPSINEDDSREVQSWLDSMKKQLRDELKKTDEINSTLTQHQSSLNKAEKLLSSYESNFTAIFRMLRFLEKSLQDQQMESRHLGNKLSSVMLDVVEVNNVLSRKVAVVGGQVREKNILVQSVAQISSCSVSPEAVTFTDCSEVQQRHNRSGVYYVTPTTAACPIPVWCDMDTPPGGWLLLLRRENGQTSFKRLWDEYKHGFGNIAEEFYLGNDNIFLLSNQKHYELRIDLWDFEGNRVYALYKMFKIDGERDNYRLHVHNFEGSARDALKKHNRQMFSTSDRDNDGYQGYNCAREWEAGWWFSNCWFGFLTGPYYNASQVRYRGISWNDWKHEQLARAEMKIRPSRLTPAAPEIQSKSTQNVNPP